MLCDSFREWGECGEADEWVGGGVLVGGSGDMFGLGYGIDEVCPGFFEFGEEEAGGFVGAGLFGPYRVSFLENPVGCLLCGGGQFGGYSCSPDYWLEVRDGFVRCSGEDCEGGKDGWVWWLWRPFTRLGVWEG